MTGVGDSWLVTGCARSGTAFTAKELRLRGLAVGHEAVFQPHAQRPPVEPHPDVSWLAAPFAGALARDGWTVVHQVRHPFKTVSSLMAIQMFRRRSHRLRHVECQATMRVLRRQWRWSWPEYAEFATSHAVGIREYRSEIERAFSYWVEWNELIERECPGALRVAVESLDTPGLDELARQLGAPEVTISVERLETAVNHRGRGPSIQLADLPNGQLRGRVTSLAGRYGYEL